MANVTESSWLLAALLQSGAAIVAIVGGVMGSRFVSAHLSLAERSFEETLESRTILGLSARRESLVAQLIKEHAKRYTQGAKFLGYLADETQHAIIDLKLSGFDQGEMLLAIQGERVQLEAQLPLALDVVSRRVKRSQPVHSLARMNPKSRGNRHYTAIFRHVYLRAASQFRDESPEHLKAYLALEREVHEADVENQALIAERLQSVSDRLTATERKLKTARGTQKVAKQRVDQIRRADGFLLGLDVLVVVAILTMAPPVVFLGWHTPITAGGRKRFQSLVSFRASLFSGGSCTCTQGSSAGTARRFLQEFCGGSGRRLAGGAGLRVAKFDEGRHLRRSPFGQAIEKLPNALTMRRNLSGVESWPLCGSSVNVGSLREP